MDMASVGRWIVAGLLVLTAASAFAQETGARPNATQAAQSLHEAQGARLRGDLEISLQKYSEALEGAKQAGNPLSASEAALGSATLIQSLSAGEKPGGLLLPKAIDQYQYVLENGTPAQRKLAGNNLALLYMQQGKTSEAVEALRAVVNSGAAAPPTGFYIYRYNLGRALEASKSLDQAYQQYQQVLGEQPGFKPAALAAFRVLEGITPPNVEEAANLAIRMIAVGQAGLAGERVHSLLRRWSGEPGARRLLVSLIDWYVATSVTPAEFNQGDSQWLEGIAKGSGAVRPAIAEIRLAFSGKLRPVWHPGEASRVFPSWRGAEWGSSSFASLLKKEGDYYDRQDEPNMALARYALAWSLEPTDTEAALYCATVLRDHRQLLDPNRALFDQLVEALFQQKGKEYEKEDWLNILRYHMVLGTIFEREERWGPESDSHSALFQWSHALDAEVQYRRSTPDFPPSPGLCLHLAMAAVHMGHTNLAWDQYLRAAEGFLHYARPTDAREALAAANSLNLTLNADQRLRHDYVQGLVDSSPADEFR